MPRPTLTELPPTPPGKAGWPWTEDGPPQPAAMPDGSPWPRISIVTPSYNQGSFLEEAIRSVLLQGYPELEYIVIDGGSTDESVAVLEKYEPWLTYSCSEPDKGSANALNKGFGRAMGDIFGCLNSDDFYLPGAFHTIAGAMRVYPWADVVYGNGFFASESGQLKKPILSDRWDTRRFAYRACMLVQQATFFRREPFYRVDGFNEANKTIWDAELWADLALAGARFHRIDDFLAAFRVYESSITGSGRLRDQYVQDTIRMFEKIMGRDETPSDRRRAFLLRAQKFSGHPFRALGYKMFYRSVLRRWSL